MPKPSVFRSIQWKPHVEGARPLGDRFRDFLLERMPLAIGIESESLRRKRKSQLRDAMQLDAPFVVAASAKDEARQLLQAAAEIEHALLVTYLYAAMSMTSTPMRREVLHVAIQEMSHLLTVQNLLLFLGESPYFSRFDLSPNPELDPFPFQLHGLRNRETLERFILAEMPVLADLNPEDRGSVEDMQARLDPDKKFHRVGVLYARIYWLFQSGDAAEGDWTDVANIADVGPLPKWHVESFPGQGSADTLQASRSETGKLLNGQTGEIWYQDTASAGAFATIDSRAAALRAIFQVASQGEGMVGGSGVSHFGQFLQAWKEFDDVEPVRFLAVPDNPSISSEPGRTEVTDQRARALCELCNLRYRIMLVAMTAALQCSRTDSVANVRRQRWISWAFFEMRIALRGIAAELVLLPCIAGGDPKQLCAAPAFEIADTELTGDITALGLELNRLHVAAGQSIAALKGLGYGTGGDLVSAIEASDLERVPDL